MKASDAGFTGFGEAYFSCVHSGAIKGWKRHSRMTLNLVCIVGKIRFVVYRKLADRVPVLDATLSPDDPAHYGRLTVPPLFWVGFSGVSCEMSMLLNVADLPHDSSEAESIPLTSFRWPTEVSTK